MPIDPTNFYQPGFTSKWFWEIINRAGDSPDELRDILAKLSRYEVWKFSEEFGIQEYGIQLSVETFAESPHKEVLKKFEIIVDEATNRCGDERGICYPDTCISDWTWQFIEQAKGDRENLGTLLLPLSKAELYRFYDEFDKAWRNFAYETIFFSKLEFESEDGTEDLFSWVISQGKEYCYRIWNNPDLTPPFQPDEPDDLRWVVDDVYEEKFGGDIGDYGDELEKEILKMWGRLDEGQGEEYNTNN